jgi:glycosyltransferase involved in cell wall biosynthesis
VVRPDRQDAVRILFVSDERAWPALSGYRHRTRLILSALAAVGSVTWICAPRNRFDDARALDVPEELRAGIAATLVPATTRSPVATAARWVGTGLPWPLAAGDWSAVDRHLARVAPAGFDLVWAMGLDALAAVERAAVGQAGADGPVVVVDADLESLKLARQLEHGADLSWLRNRLATVDVGRWARLEGGAAARLAGFSVCSEEERRRLGGNAFVTPNAYPDVAADGAGPDPAERSVLLFVGSMGYEPNRQGVEWFVDRVFEPVRRRRPQARLRIVGSGPPLDGARAAEPGVEVVGEVADVGRELGGAAAVVAPIHWGAGTRVKILEALAHRLPVVSTTVGAEGLGLVDGQHLLIADTPEAFAEACVRALDGGRELADMVARAHDVFRRHHAETVVSHRLEHQVRELLAGRSPG